MATFDVLLALASLKEKFASHGAVCMPSFVWPQNDEPSSPIFEAQNLGNALMLGADMICNDVRMDGKALVLTGPNMSGKTTLMRSVGLASILAHLGAFVPAQSLIISPVDQVFTRIGASDSLLEMQSSFLVEMSEATVILRQASSNSLILIDELGKLLR